MSSCTDSFIKQIVSVDSGSAQPSAGLEIHGEQAGMVLAPRYPEKRGKLIKFQGNWGMGLRCPGRELVAELGGCERLCPPGSRGRSQAEGTRANTGTQSVLKWSAVGVSFQQRWSSERDQGS